MSNIQVKASLQNYRQAPRKARLVADYVRGKSVPEALAQLQFVDKRAGGVFIKLLKSAAANAEHNFKLSSHDLVVKEIRVDSGRVLKRTAPKAFGRSGMIRKKTSHVNLVLGTP